jgi:cyclophilin family peptidyl-prolyl cis-trans isomerase
MLRPLVSSALAIALGAGIAAASPDSTKTAASTTKPATGKATVKKTTTKPAGEQVVVLQTGQGNIVIRLKDKDAPKTAANFRKLVNEKFYDGTYFHRVIRGFMIQGGDPNTKKNTDPADDGQGGPGYTVPAEIKLPHLRGSVATARLGDQVNPKRESSGSQFFIDVAPQASLDAGGYTVFGEVISGMDAVDKIVAMADDTTLPMAGGGGRNPGKTAIIVRAYLEPLAKWQSAAAPTTTAK